jgi:hypothetical protein
MVEAAQRMGLYRGQSVHGFRRGSMQHSRDSGATLDAIAQRAKIKTPAVLARYLNKRRSHVKQIKQERAKRPKVQ